MLVAKALSASPTLTSDRLLARSSSQDTGAEAAMSIFAPGRWQIRRHWRLLPSADIRANHAAGDHGPAIASGIRIYFAIMERFCGVTGKAADDSLIFSGNAKVRRVCCCISKAPRMTA
jgi:hypothetical protein